MFSCGLYQQKIRRIGTTKFNLYFRPRENNTKEESLKCEQCAESFSCSYELSSHMKVHSGEKSVSCPHCTKYFGNSRNLNRHMKVHAVDKPFNCSQCTMSFAQKIYLERHLRAHTGEKPFVRIRASQGTGSSGPLVSRMSRTQVFHAPSHPTRPPFSSLKVV